ncbi:hypothetical protein QBZ16_005460 [Prototheca wickerhamii]|uniref:Uncharacterized protein n=1 Tax=Prototheca wickerhamii TaxID=3111 RepID=A0AAD9IHF6_PROWI|nr:hypothetical protein QBZ16_005460 [Prototheca wickerhamii]
MDYIKVSPAFDLEDLSVTLSVAYPDVQKLKISLMAQPPTDSMDSLPSSSRTILLKMSGVGGRGSLLQKTSFNDSASIGLPEDQTHQPFTGTYIPTQRLGFMHEGGDGTLASQGGSQGTWILRVEDPTLNGTKGDIALNGWTLRLCGKEAPVETIVDTTVGMTATVQSASLSSPTPSPAADQPSLRGAYATYADSAFGDCQDAACEAAKQKIWKGALFAVHAAAAMDGLKQSNHDLEFLVTKLRDFLPGDNPRLLAYINWLQSNQDRFDELVSSIREAIGADSQPSALEQAYTNLFNGLSKLPDIEDQSQKFMKDLKKWFTL